MQEDYLIPRLKEKIIDSNARSIYVNAHPRKSINRIDVLSMQYLSENLDTQSISTSLLYNQAFKYSFPIRIASLSENRNARRLLHLLRRNNDFKNELNIDPFAIGYPLIEVADDKKKRINSIPILIWDMTIAGNSKRTGSISLSRKSSDGISINPSLVSLIKRKYNPSYEPPILEAETLVFSSILEVINTILYSIGCMPLNENHAFYPLDYFEETLPKYSITHRPKLINNGVFGLYASSKESIISDYTQLERKAITCHFQMTQNLNDTLYTGVPLDHSQQRVIRTLRKGRNTVIHGPPGTGKSKTLTAIISYILSKGQSCLIVCEKKTAIDVLYENLSELGFEEFCINISDVRKDRRKVVNKTRDLIADIKGGNQIFNLNQKKKKNYTRTEQKLIFKKIEKVNEVIKLINKTKKRLNKPILGEILNYSDLVIAIKSDRYKALTTSLDLKLNEFTFEINEYLKLEPLLTNITRVFNEQLNPYNSFYEHIEDAILNLNKDSFELLIDEIHSSCFLKLKTLEDRIEKALIGKNSFAFKYMNYVDSEDNVLKQIQKEFIYYLNEINKKSLFSKNFKNQIQAIPLNKQITLVSNTLQLIFENKKDFEFLKSFNKQYQALHTNEQLLVKRAGTIKDFNTTFFDWYFLHLLNGNAIDNFDFNGFEKGYYDIENDVKHVNDFILNDTHNRLKRNRLRGISKFNDSEKELSIEQFFSKKSTTTRVKHSLTKISNHESGILKTFFPVCMTNPSSCSSLFPLEKGYFDYVIYDESSQLKIEDTYPSLLRGKVSIVAGDLHQLPPMDYFMESKVDDYETETIKFNKTTSLLDFCITENFKSHYLDIHYRSKHPDLINFSNAAFYKSRLIPQPPQNKYKAIEFYPSNGKFLNRINRIEALEIVQYIEDEIPLDKSIGIATFSLKQREEVLNQIELRSKSSAPFFVKMNALKEHGFFVKNIENIQGEERDIIIIGTTYGLDQEGVFKQKFGPINTKKRGHKLLNVIITRAIEKLVIFSSIPEAKYTDYKTLISENGNRGKSILFAYLSYAKAISTNDQAAIETVLNTIGGEHTNIYNKNKLNESHLKSFSIYLIEKLSGLLKKELTFKNNVKIGGYIFELGIIKNREEMVLIDINGKSAYEGFEDYIFDIDRRNIALQTNAKYYRLWLSNFYNNPDFEINKISRLLEF